MCWYRLRLFWFVWHPDSQLPTITQDYHNSGSNKAPRYFQLQAINKTIEAITRGRNRILLVMATGTGKTYTAFQIIWRFLNLISFKF